MHLSKPVFAGFLAGAAALFVGITPSAAAPRSFLGSLNQVSTVASTVPASSFMLPGDGDVNPYGVAVVDQSVGRLQRGDVLVSNFNNSTNAQGTGTTIVSVDPHGSVRVFARIPQLPGGTGLTTALAILPRGYVVVGSLPTTDGTSATTSAGALVILDPFGGVVTTLSGGDINGPWDLTAVSHGDRSWLFFTNVLNGTVAGDGNPVPMGTVVRLELDLSGSFPRVVSNTVIGSGFPEETNSAALVLGPTGVGLGSHGTLYVADTVDNTIQAIPDALTRTTSAGLGTQVSSSDPRVNHLNAPLGLTVAPNGDIVTVDGGDGLAVETSPSGQFVADTQLDSSGSPPGSGALFGLAVTPDGHGLYFVDDATNTLDLLSR